MPVKCSTESSWRIPAAASCHALGLVASVFTLAVALTLAVAELQVRARPPLDLAWAEPLVLAARGGGRDAAETAAALAQLDLLARQAYFRHVFFRNHGLHLLLGGLAVSVLAFGAWIRLILPPPDPRSFGGAAQPAGSRRVQAAAVAVASALAVLAVAFLRLRPISIRPALPEVPVAFGAGPSASGDPVAEAPSDAPTPALDFSLPTTSSWPMFRGFHGDGVSDAIPPAHEVLANARVRWKTPLARPGFSSPVVWEDLIFLTAGDADSREVLAFDLESGELQWSATVPFRAAPGTPLPVVSADTGFAAATPAADSQNVYAIFATGDLVAIRHDGVIRWQRNLGVPDVPYGHASSLIASHGVLFVQVDHGDGGRALAVGGTDGTTIWEIGRDVGSSWASPSLLKTPEQTVLLLNAPDRITAYGLARGNELWSVTGVSGEVAPSAAIADGRLFLAQEYSRLVAFDLTSDPPEELWEAHDELPDISSPVAGHGSVWMASTYGTVSCHDAATGELRWRHEYADGFNASPILAGGGLYLLDLKGVLRVLGTGSEHEELAVVSLGDPCFATPAFLEGRLVIRTRSSLLCLP